MSFTSEPLRPTHDGALRQNWLKIAIMLTIFPWTNEPPLWCTLDTFNLNPRSIPNLPLSNFCQIGENMLRSLGSSMAIIEGLLCWRFTLLGSATETCIFTPFNFRESVQLLKLVIFCLIFRDRLLRDGNPIAVTIFFEVLVLRPFFSSFYFPSLLSPMMFDRR